MILGGHIQLNTKHTLFRLLQRWQKELDNSGIIGTIFMDLCNAFTNRQFNYAPIICMFFKKLITIKWEKTHYRVLKSSVVVKNHTKSFFWFKNEVSIHQRHIRAIAMEVFNLFNYINPEYIVLFYIQTLYWNRPILKLPRTNTTCMGINCVLFKACLL